MDKLIDIRRHNVLVFDIETSMSHKDYETFAKSNPDLAEEFLKKFDDKPEKYQEVGALYAEYGRVISCSFTTIKYNAQEKEFASTTKSFYGHDEAELLEKIGKVLGNEGWVLAGMNLNAFDIPFILKRMMHHGIKPPQTLINQVFAKPWERKIIDLADIWAFGGFGAGSKSTKLGAICASIGIDTPKDGVYGPYVPIFYWTGICEPVYGDKQFSMDEALDIIDEYGQKDTIATAGAIIRLNDILFA